MVYIQRGLSPELVSSAANLFLTALGEKFVPILGNEANAIALVESSIVSTSCLSAEEDGKLLGVLAIQTNKQSFLDPDFKDLRAHYGIVGGIIRAAGLTLLQHSPKPKELYIEGIAVADFDRGKGVGTKLFDELMIFARSQGFERVTLQVIDTNPRALKLYERFGFTIEKRSKVWPVNRMIGWHFSESIFMGRVIG
jgi:ribosomal protein S18 acetylase RimI-like enzyme